MIPLLSGTSVVREESIHMDCWHQQSPTAGPMSLYLTPVGPPRYGDSYLGARREQNPASGARPNPTGPDRTGLNPAGEPELRGEPVVVVKAAENWVCHDLDRGILKGSPPGPAVSPTRG